jgi:CheY-like chemotaxis protein/HPt (histidine-containing phosphotransfer) domain-containing protein
MDRQRLETEKERQERQLAGTIEELRKDNLRLELAGEEAREGWHRQAGMLAEMDRSIERSLGEIASAAEHFRQRSLPAEAQRHGEALYQAVTELLRLVTEVRQTDADAVETLRLKPALYPVIARERNRAAGREVAVRFQPHRELPRAIRGHRDSLRQVALSLVSHAVQRAEPGTEVTVTLRCGSPEGAPRDLRMTVTASTAGQSSPGQEGDLWLALCRRIVTTLGGRLEMESSQALVTFWLTLPLEVAPEPPWSEARAQPEARSHLHLLLIHGHPVQRRVVQGIAEDLGYNVWTAADGQAALQELPHHRTDLVLLDAEIRAPDLAHTARAIRQWGAGGEGLPLIALTTAPEALDLEGSDLDDAVGKPLQRDALAAALDHWLCLHLEAPPAPITDEFAVPKGPALDEERLELLRRLGRDQRDVLAELAELFLAQKDDRLEALRGALGAANFEDIRRVAHSLKGSGSNLGASPLARLCGRLERLADTGDLQGCRGLLDAITEETDRVALALRQYIDAPP